MLQKIIDFHLRQRWVVLLGVSLIVLVGVSVMLRIPVDAFPDLTNTQVVVVTEFCSVVSASLER